MSKSTLGRVAWYLVWEGHACLHQVRFGGIIPVVSVGPGAWRRHSCQTPMVTRTGTDPERSTGDRAARRYYS